MYLEFNLQLTKLGFFWIASISWDIIMSWDIREIFLPAVGYFFGSTRPQKKFLVRPEVSRNQQKPKRNQMAANGSPGNFQSQMKIFCLLRFLDDFLRELSMKFCIQILN